MPTERMCNFANCNEMIGKGQGVSVNFGSWRMRFCSRVHAMWWLEDWEQGINRTTEDTMRQYAEADPKRKKQYDEKDAQPMPTEVIDAFELDDAIEAGTADQLVGRRASNGVGITGPVVKLRNGEIAIKIRMYCQCRRKRFVLYLTSGLHKGAFCYIADINGEYEGNLRDEIVVCDKCDTRRQRT